MISITAHPPCDHTMIAMFLGSTRGCPDRYDFAEYASLDLVSPLALAVATYPHPTSLLVQVDCCVASGSFACPVRVPGRSSGHTAAGEIV